MAISKQQSAHPEAALIVAGDSMSPYTRGDKTLDHVYRNIVGAYMATPLSHLGQSDYLFLFLTPKYSTMYSSVSVLINHVKPSVKTFKVWPVGVDYVL